MQVAGVCLPIEDTNRTYNTTVRGESKRGLNGVEEGVQLPRNSYPPTLKTQFLPCDVLFEASIGKLRTFPKLLYICIEINS